MPCAHLREARVGIVTFDHTYIPWRNINRIVYIQRPNRKVLLFIHIPLPQKVHTYGS